MLDSVGSSYLERNIAALARHGRILLIGDQSGGPAAFTIGALMAKWGSIHGSTLRARPLDERRQIIASVLENVWPLVAAGQVRPVIAYAANGTFGVFPYWEVPLVPGQCLPGLG